MLVMPDTKIRVDGHDATVLESNGRIVVLDIEGVGVTSMRLQDIMFDRDQRFEFPGETVHSPYAFSKADWVTAGPTIDEEFKLADARFKWVKHGVLPDSVHPDQATGYPDLAGVTERIQHLAAKNGIKERAMWDRYACWRKGDHFGALGRARRKNHRPHPSVSPRYLEEAVLYSVQRLESGKSKVSRKNFHKRLRARIKRIETTAGEVVPIPKKTLRYEVVSQALKKAGTFDATIKRQEGNASRNDAAYGHIDATRPGEYFLVDSTRLDVHALSAFSSKWEHVELTIMMDLYSRTIVASRLSPITTDGLDIALLFYDMLNPRREKWVYGSDVVLPTAGVPSCILVDPETGEPGYSDTATMPGVRPETLVTDNGKVFISRQFNAICAANAISILRGRLLKGSDKGHVEQMFRRINSDLIELLTGHKGFEPGEHGGHVEIDSSFLLEELDDMIRQYFADFYHRADHSGISPFDIPNEPWTPLEKLEEGIARSGIRMTNRSADMALDLLPIKWVRIQHWGVQVAKLRYSGRALTKYIGIRSAERGMKGKWPIAYNPQDRQHCYFLDPETEKWEQLTWVGAETFSGPFSASMMYRSIKRSRDLGKVIPRSNCDEEVADALISLVDYWDDIAQIPHEDEQILARMAGYKNPWRKAKAVISSFRDLFQIKTTPTYRIEMEEHTTSRIRTPALTGFVRPDTTADEIDDDSFYEGVL